MEKLTSTFKVEYKENTLFNKWIVVLENVSQKEAQKYIKKRTGFMGKSKDRFRIINENINS